MADLVDGLQSFASRRTVLRSALRSLLGAAVIRLLTPRIFAAPLLLIDRLAQEHGFEDSRATEWRYRAHAYVHILAIPVFSRQDVGGGYAVIEEARNGFESIVGLQFAGGSAPERTRGLNKVGLIQEAVIQQNGSVTESAYYGFMISSGEKNLDQARKSLQTDTAGSIPYSAASGVGKAGRFQCTVSHLAVPGRFNWHCFEELSRDMRSLIAAAPEAKDFDVPLASASSKPDTFLYSMRRAILSPNTKTSCPIVYNGKRFILTTEKQIDAKAGRQMSERKITHSPDLIWRLNGTITETTTRQPSNFQVWFEKGEPSGLPVHIEFYPKSFLKLVFERDLSTDGPKVARLLNDRPAAATVAVARNK